MKLRIGLALTLIMLGLSPATAWSQQPVTIRLGHVG